MISIAEYHAYGILIASFALGATFGYRFSPKVQMAVETFCYTPLDYSKTKSVKITKVLANGKCTNISCRHIAAKGICKLTNKKCSLLDFTLL